MSSCNQHNLCNLWNNGKRISGSCIVFDLLLLTLAVSRHFSIMTFLISAEEPRTVLLSLWREVRHLVSVAIRVPKYMKLYKLIIVII